MISEVLKYEEIRENISKEIEHSPFKTDYIIKKSGINYSTFYRKLKNNSFTSKEILTILLIIKPEEAKKYHFQKLLKESLKEVEEGKTISHEEMKKYINEKYGFEA